MIFILIFTILIIFSLIGSYIYLTYRITPKQDRWAGFWGFMTGIFLLAGFIIYLLV